MVHLLPVRLNCHVVFRKVLYSDAILGVTGIGPFQSFRYEAVLVIVYSPFSEPICYSRNDD